MSSPDFGFTRPGGSFTSIKTLAQVASWDGIYSSPPFRGENNIIPGRRGQDPNPLVYDAYTFPVPLMLLGGTQAGFQDSLRSLQALIESSETVIDCSRVVGGSGGDLTQTCAVQARVGEVGMVNGLLNGRVSLEVTNLDGAWYGPQVSFTRGASSAQTILGVAPTRRITITTTGSGTLTNTTTGVTLVVTGAHTLNVEAHTTSGSLANVSASGDPFGFWFNLAPGANTLAWAGTGTTTIAYRPAY